MEILKNDMTKEEMVHTLAILLGNGVKVEELKSLHAPVIIKMLNGLEANARAYNDLEDKYRELLQKGTYAPLAPKVRRNRRNNKGATRG